ncbi:CPBP family intramembrane metalloprotease [Flavobacteriaceae bacterium S0825]|uniref:CPBP family intramembrane glutamic endopeptidase n=1 Tax=Gaetbulibacter sp. S0825 TaxID=2720084 RepID=UPI0014320546|nr:CPBP family intramembrane glutamic endopeptidase [Gaetbulibacter sp. S0825]MCK0108842.1 CPBP family intramembrane metalloprotease [Flavobacteriaceae bacterium S0825]NIX64478.1 CPBP family intramembrane metalloprotease [Gaetbulibacter sp. S0825]
MLGLLVIIVVSWVLLRFIEKKNIEALGIVPNLNRLIQFVIGFFIIAVIVLINIYIETIILKVEWELYSIDYNTIFNAFVYHLRSALTEELVFRGAILYILIQRIGAIKAIWLSAIVFGVYHWFSYGIIGERIILLAYVFVITGFTGYVWAYTFHKTKSIMLGLGFHLGYNLIMSFFYESQPFGELIMSQTSKVGLIGWNEFYYSMFKGLFPTMTTLVCVKLLLKTKLYPQKENQ